MAQWTEDSAAHYTSASGDEHFGWADGAGKGPKQLAMMFLDRFPRLAAQGYGADWEYAGWLEWMLAQTADDELPYTFSEWDSPDDRLLTTRSAGIPLPPAGQADDEFEPETSAEAR